MTHQEAEQLMSTANPHRSRWRLVAASGLLAFAAGCDSDGTLVLPGSDSSEHRGASEADTGPASTDSNATTSSGTVPGDTPRDGSASPAATDGSAVGSSDGSGDGAGSGGSGGSGSIGNVGGGAVVDWSSTPHLLDPVAIDDAALGRQALALMGSSAVGASGSCATCHALGRPTLTHWQQLTKSFSDACLQSSSLSDQAAVDTLYGCFESHAASPTGFAPTDFGVFAAAAHLPWFGFVLGHATPNQSQGSDARDQFVAHVGMPRAGEPFTQEQFALVAEWFTRGLPGLFELVPEDSGVECTPWLDTRLATHVSDMGSRGWAARNAEVPLLMFGCKNGEQGATCLRTLPAAASQPYGATWDVVPGTTIRILWDNSAAPTNYWSRSSADGRFIASGLAQPGASGLSGQILDLQRGVAIPADFAYDATFFPDNSGFMVQRGHYAPALPGGLPTDGNASAADVAITCEQSVLADDPATVTGTEPECTTLQGQIGLYEQLARSLDGDDYWVVYGAYGEDDGGFHTVTDNPAAAFETQSITTLLPMVNQGNGYEPGPPSRVQTPLQGDPMLSPSGRLLVTRVKGKERTVRVDGVDVVTAEQSGYALNLVTTTTAGGAPSATAEEVGRICINGSKPTLSFDERWMVLHHYVTPADARELGFADENDPGFAAYAELGASNIYLVDLLDGTSRRITNVQPGQYALFPHFRADGWLYFVVRTLDTDEWFVASDAALADEPGSASPLPLPL